MENTKGSKFGVRNTPQTEHKKQSSKKQQGLMPTKDNKTRSLGWNAARNKKRGQRRVFKNGAWKD